jgi:hypothetical protein
MASAGPAAADRIDSLPRWRAAAGRPAPAKQEREACQSRGSATGTVPAARCGNSRKRQHHAARRPCGQQHAAVCAGAGSVPRIPRAATPGAACGGRCIAIDISSSALFWRRLRGRSPWGIPPPRAKLNVSSGGVADWPQYGRSQEGTWPRWARHKQVPREDRTVERRCIHVERPQLTEQPEEGRRFRKCRDVCS